MRFIDYFQSIFFNENFNVLNCVPSMKLKDINNIQKDLLDKLKPLKDRFDILVVSHSLISEISYDDIDYF